jgi:hypothetical protein
MGWAEKIEISPAQFYERGRRKERGRELLF